uniref:Uncharacterized protein n=1 Tax=Aquila chrysaetos chrysaetos TaxID=223781 RepID=A0A663F0Z6_AQUCH
MHCFFTLPFLLIALAQSLSQLTARGNSKLSPGIAAGKKSSVPGVSHSDSLPVLTYCPLWGNNIYLTPFPCPASKTEGTWERNITYVNFTWPHWYNRTQQKRFLIYIKLHS